jgi:hypothetical protein
MLLFYWGTLWHLQKWLQYILDSPPPSFSFIPNPPFLEQLFPLSLFIFIHEHTVFPSYSPLTFPYVLSPPTGTNYQTGLVLPSCFIMIFPCTYILYSQLIHLLHFSPFYLSPLLMLLSTGLSTPYSFLCREYIYHIHLLYFLFLPSSSQ